MLNGLLSWVLCGVVNLALEEEDVRLGRCDKGNAKVSSTPATPHTRLGPTSAVGRRGSPT